jgi:hypothetical protein
VVPAGAMLKCVIVSPVRFQNRVVASLAACTDPTADARMQAIAIRVSRMVRTFKGWLQRLRCVIGVRRGALARVFPGCLLLLVLCGPLFSRSGRAADESGYATAVRAEYVFACMATNGGTQEALQHCSCAIDVIASVLPYDKYEQAETILRMRRSAGGYLGQEFRSASSNGIVRDLEEAQAEAEVRCF